MQGVSVYVLRMSVQVAPVISAVASYSGPSHVNRKQYAFDELLVPGLIVVVAIGGIVDCESTGIERETREEIETIVVVMGNGSRCFLFVTPGGASTICIIGTWNFNRNRSSGIQIVPQFVTVP